MIVLRHGRLDERAALEDLQRRASLVYEEYRAYLLANPDVIELPLAQLAESRGGGWAELQWPACSAFARCCRAGRMCDLDGLFVEPGHRGAAASAGR